VHDKASTRLITKGCQAHYPSLSIAFSLALKQVSGVDENKIEELYGIAPIAASHLNKREGEREREKQTDRQTNR